MLPASWRSVVKKSTLLMSLCWLLLGCQSLPSSSPAGEEEAAEEESQSSQDSAPPPPADASPSAPKGDQPSGQEEALVQEKLSLPAPKMPAYHWQLHERQQAMMISNKEWQALLRYLKEFDLYAKEIQSLLLSLDPDRILPLKPTIILPTFNPVPSQDVLGKDRNQRHLYTSKEEASRFDALMQACQRYITQTQALLA